MDKIFTLLKLLTEYTDDDHKLTTSEIIGKFEEMGSSVHRNSIPSEMRKLESAGYDIICERCAENRYFLGSRLLEPAEVKLICEALRSAQFVSKRKEKQLTKKLTSRLSIYQTNNIKKTLSQSNKNKAEDASMYHFYDITTAIELNRKIKFKYTCYNEKKEKVYKHNGYVYTVSPYSTDWNDGRCYVSGYSERHNGVAVFRIDRIEELKVTNEEALPKPDDFDSAALMRRRFGMYGNDTITNVMLKCKNNQMNAIVDKFGEDVETHEYGDGDEYFVAVADVGLSPTFYGWLFQYGEDISILSPMKAVEEYVLYAKKVIDLHNKLCSLE